MSKRGLVGLMLMTLGSSGRPAAAQSRAIADNSFLIEEAYNHELGVVQHITTGQRSLRSATWGSRAGSRSYLGSRFPMGNRPFST